MAKLALVNGRLIDGTGHAPREGWGLVLDGASIQAVGHSRELRVPADAQVVDLGGRTLMPGLIDAHTHLTYHVSEYALILQQINESLELNTIKAVESARVVVESGCTAVGDGGSRGNIATAIRDAVNSGTIIGPKVVAAGQMISGSSGIADHTAAFGYIDADAFLGVVVNGAQEVRAAVRKQVRHGVDWIKVTASGTPGNFWIDGRTEDLGYEEIAAAVQEAAKFGRSVHAHAHNPGGMRNAARAGVISIHSGEFADEAALEALKEHDCVFVPTIAWLHFRINEEYAREFTRAYKPTQKQLDWFIEDCRQAYEAARDAIRMAYRNGVPMGVGTDAAHVFPPFDIVREMEYYQELGIPPLEIITMATKVSAQALGRSESWGTLEAGKAADLLVVAGDPSTDVGVLRDKERIELIMVDGRVVKDTLSRVRARA